LAQIRFGIIGCGRFMGNSHIPRLVASKETEIVGLADPTLESIDQRQTDHPTLNSVPDYRDHREMLRKQNRMLLPLHPLTHYIWNTQWIRLPQTVMSY